MKSIRLKLFVVFILLLVVFQGISLITSTYFLDEVFVSSNQKTMVKIYNKFKNKDSEKENGRFLLYEMANELGGNITLIDKDMRIISSSSSHHMEHSSGYTISNIRENIKEIEERNKEYTIFSVNSYGNSDRKTMILIGRVFGNQYLIAEKSLEIVYESSNIAERFIIVSSIGTFVIGSIIVYFLSRRLTKPIIYINHVVQEIANLNFDKKVEKTTEDELGVLGESINLISDKLSSVLKELRQSNAKLKEDIEKERRLEKMRRKFVSSVSHELKTPISMIQGYADGLKFNIARNAEDREYYCDVIIDETDKMDHLVKDLLDLSSYESGVFKIVKSTFDLTELVQETMNKYGKVFQSKNIRFDFDFKEKCLIDADKLRIEQVITNFISNAEKHVSENGCVKIEIMKTESHLYLSVFNTGEPIPSFELQNIWTSFYKIDEKGKKTSIGTGLGLAIVKAIIDLHKGTCGADNVEGGVKLWIEIPTETVTSYF